MKVLIAAGGSGGHLFPGIALAGKILETFPETEMLFLTSARQQDKEILTSQGYAQRITWVQIPAHAFPYRFSLRAVGAGLSLLTSCLRSFVIMRRFRPQVVIGFGACLAAGVIPAAKLLGIPAIIHEQNIVPGRANRILAKIADRVALSFKETATHFKTNKHKIIVTGNFLREEFFDLKYEVFHNKFNLDPDKFTILVMGGSQGSQSVNRLFTQALEGLNAKLLKNIQVIHITGKRDYPRVRSFYRDIKVKSRIMPFLFDAVLAYKQAKLFVGRCGATTLAEIICCKLPSILIPYSGAFGHQSYNAEYLFQKGVSIVIKEKQTAFVELRKVLEELIKNQKKLLSLSKNFEDLSCFPARGKELLIDEISRLAKKY